MKTNVERLRQFVGLDGLNLMRIVGQAASIVKTKKADKKKPDAGEVRTWLTKNVDWGRHDCPSVDVVKRHIANWETLESCARAYNFIQASLIRWGRDNMLDVPSKFGICCQKSDKLTLAFVIEWLYSFMRRGNQKDPFSEHTLRQDVIPAILWIQMYVKKMLKEYPEVVKDNPKLKQLLLSPHALFEKVEGPGRDATYINTLPHEAQKLLCKHVLELYQDSYRPEIRGALSQVGHTAKYDLKKFQNSERVSKRFRDPFSIAYDSLVGATKKADDDEEDPKAEAEETKMMRSTKRRQGRSTKLHQRRRRRMTGAQEH